jgi:hypothetical protein
MFLCYKDSYIEWGQGCTWTWCSAWLSMAMYTKSLGVHSFRDSGFGTNTSSSGRIYPNFPPTQEPLEQASLSCAPFFIQ